jgi:AcrR family transcriptional regulator
MSRRDELVEGAVAYALREGVSGLSLRPLAAALGTSDRMLVYYFGTRDAVVQAVLEAVAARLRGLLAGALAPAPAPPARILAAALAVAATPEAQAPLRLWLEVAGQAARGDEIYTATAKAVITDWIDWLAAHLDVPETDRRAAAAGLLGALEGLLVVRLAGDRSDAFAGGEWLVRALG